MNKILFSTLLSSAFLLAGNNNTLAQLHVVKPVSLNSKASVAKTTSTTRRIIAQSNYNYLTGAYVMNDSNKFEWYAASYQISLPTIVPTFAYENAMSNEYYRNIDDTTRPQTKILKTYNAAGKITKLMNYSWNAGTAKWDSISKISYLYFGGKLMQDEYEQRISAGAGGFRWVVRYKNDYAYKAGLLDTKTSYTARNFFISGNFKPSSQTTYAYTSGTIYSIADALWDSSATVSPGFYNSSRLLLAFSGKDTIMKTNQRWNKTISDWVNYDRTSYDFSKGKYSEDLTENWDSKNGVWQNYKKDSLGFTGSLWSSHYLFSWDAAAKKWINHTYYEFTFTGANMAQFLSYYRDGSTWVKVYKYTFDYDSHNDVVAQKIYRWNGTDYAPHDYNSLINYYYEDFDPTSIKEPKQTAIKTSLYPNPALNNHSYLDFFMSENVASEIQVVDMTGRIVKRITEAAYIGDHSVLIELGDNASGTYLVNLIAEGQLMGQSKLQK